MATVKIIDKIFVNEEGREIPYKRLSVSGVINGEVNTLEIKVTSTEAMLMEMLLKGDQPVQNVVPVRTSESKQADLVAEAEKAEREAENKEIVDDFQSGFKI